MSPRRSSPEQDLGAWATLHGEIEREGVDVPSQFTLDRLPSVLRQREVPPPVSRPGRRPGRQSMVRPYTRTGGRTRPDRELALEAMVSTSERGKLHEGAASAEQRAICDLCVHTKSVAEVAAYLALPLGVVKVIIGDLAYTGALHVHQSGLTIGDRSSREFLERVLDGLRSV